MLPEEDKPSDENGIKSGTGGDVSHSPAGSGNKEELMTMSMKPAKREDEDDVAEDDDDDDVADERIKKKKSFSFLLQGNGGNSNSNEEEDECGTEEEQALFIKELEAFHKQRGLDFRPPKFYGEYLNLLRLWRSVIRLGGYDYVTSCKVWRTIGDAFKPPKTCTTVSWTFRCFYEKALLEYERYKMSMGELPFNDASCAEPVSSEKLISQIQTTGSGRARRDAAARAMQGWHSQRLLGNGEVGDPIIKDKTSSSMMKRDKQSIGLLKRKKPSPVERAVKVARMKALLPQLDNTVVDVGPPADWVKINVQRTKDCFEVYALVPGLLREEVRVQSDPAGRLVISGQPEQLDNPWGVSSFKKVVSLPSRIDPHQTSAVVTLHGQLFVRVPFEQSSL
uniref:AT-rich interactive domain-containing protein 5-like n=1 Tax=Erigeron canadensis TaxID=72917 RepID=UPI001CB9AF78|nr:AT-rich interactive domain-containing protein 5-like [Erigeron canadensis]